MPFIVVSRSGLGLREKILAECLAKELRAVVLRVKELNLKSESAVSVSFPADALAVNQDEPVIVTVSLLFDKPERTLEIRRRLAEEIFDVVKRFFQSFTPGGVEHRAGGRPVEVAVLPPFNPAHDAFCAG